MADSSKDTIIKMLLSSPNQSQTDNQEGLKIMDTSNDVQRKDLDIESSKLINYLEQLNGQEEIINPIQLDHSYSKPWNWRPDNTYAKPAKTLFISKPVANLKRNIEEDIVVDIENESPKPAYDETKAKLLMNETEKHITLLRPDEGNENWDVQVDRTDWTVAQIRIFERTVRILNQDRLARLTFVGSWNEPVLRRVVVDKSARRFRTMFASFSWQTKLVNWLHNLLLEILEMPYLIAYVDILQALKKKVPSLVDRILSQSTVPSNLNIDALPLLLKKPWDPSSAGLSCHLPKRLPGNPLIVIVPGGTGVTNMNNPKIQRWYNHLSLIGTVVLVGTNNLIPTKVTVLTSLEHMMSSTRAKIADLKSEHVGKNIILVGFNSGAALACQVALIEPVMAVICLGFPVNTVDEKRGQPDDSILNLNVPILFIIGQHAATAHVEDVEDLRERLRVDNGLIIIGAADDNLRINKSKQSAEGITQSMLDRCILDEIADFIGTILLTPYSSRADINRSRLKIGEKKRKLDDIFTRKTVGSYRRGKGSTRGIGRTKWNAQGHETLSAISKKTGISRETLLAATRQSIEKIGIVNSAGFERLTTDGRDQQIKILPQFKFLSNEDFVGADSSFVDQLTPDRLLEMPVIIQEDSPESPVKVVVPTNTSSQLTGMRCLPSGQSQVKCATIFFKNKEGVGIKGGLTQEERAILMKDTRPRIRNFPAKKHANHANQSV